MQILHSNIIGEGKPLIILHGFLGMSDNWKTLGKQYAESGFEVHMLDQRNHGRSFHSNEFSYELMTTDLLKYCEQQQLSTINLIGHSMGGKTAMLFATTHPNKVEKLLIADIGPKEYPPHHQTILEGLNAINFENIQSRNDADQHLANYVSEFGTRQFLMKNIYRKTKTEFGFRCNLESLTTNYNEIGNALPTNSIFNKKALFLRGDKSNYIIEGDIPLIKQHFPLAVVQNIENAGHWLHAENSKMFFDKSITFLNS